MRPNIIILVLQLPVSTKIGVAIIGYIPEIISVLLILAFAVFSANTIETLLIKNTLRPGQAESLLRPRFMRWHFSSV